MNCSDFEVREFQGEWGPVNLSERIIQWVWHEQDFETSSLRTRTGESLEILSPGRWNQTEGPDFLGAHLRIGGQECQGDVEIHFEENQWRAHGHDRSADFDNVVLHVLVFPPRVGSLGLKRAVPTLVLLPYLHQDLEAYAEAYALQGLHEYTEDWLAGWANMDRQARWNRVYALAQLRWRNKLERHRHLLRLHGWEKAAHLRMLEVLGYRRNSAPMRVLALERSPDAILRADPHALFDMQRGYWRLRGCRPANHPRLRLIQYQQVLRHRFDWAETAARLILELPRAEVSVSTRDFRRQTHWQTLMRGLDERALGGGIPGSRAATLLVDALIPLTAAAHEVDLESHWFHAPVGDVAEFVRRAVKRSGLLEAGQVHCNGLIQAMIAHAMHHARL